VDDDAGTRSVLRRLLEALGASVHEAANGLEAWAGYGGLAPDMVITDYMMPGMDGFELAGRISAAADGVRACPVIIHSGSPLSREDIEKSGAFAFVGKPVSLEQMRRILESARRELRAAGRAPAPGG